MEAPPTDTDLLARARTHPDVIGLLYERHARAVHRFLSRRVGGAADDLLSEVFVAAVEARLRVQPHPSGSALPWLYGIAGNIVRTHLRRRPTPWVGDRVDDIDWEAVDDRVDATARRHELRAALGTLSADDRQLVLLVAWDELSPTDAAAVLGISAVAARSRLHRARTRAQAALTACTPANEETLR